MIKTGIMGGTFNPVHNAHLLIAQQALEQLGLESVWFITSGNPPHKQGSRITDARLRQKMVALAIDKNPRFEVCPYEVDRAQYSYTADTLTEFSRIYPEREFYFIIGADSLAQMDSWYKPEVIAQHCIIAVFARMGTDGLDELVRLRSEELSADIRIIDAPSVEISSSDIRERLSAGKSVRYMLPDSVMEFIRQHDLYKEKVMMDTKQMKKKLKSMLREDRYAHSKGVCETAVRLAEIYGADKDKAYIAGLLHDAAKNMDKKKMLSECERLGVTLDEIQRSNTALVHAVLGAAYIKEQFGIEDDEILNAVRYHTTGKPAMTLLEKIIYIADMVEPNRDYDGVRELRAIVEKDIDEACILGLSQTLEFTLKKGGLIHEDTIRARNYLIMNKN